MLCLTFGPLFAGIPRIQSMFNPFVAMFLSLLVGLEAIWSISLPGCRLLHDSFGPGDCVTFSFSYTWCMNSLSAIADLCPKCLTVSTCTMTSDPKRLSGPGFRIVRPVKSWRRDRAGESW